MVGPAMIVPVSAGTTTVSTPGPGPGRYELLVSAVAGRPLVPVALAPGELPYTDGCRVYVRSTDAADPRRELVVQAALVAAGSLDPAAMRRLVGRPRVARRYLVLEAHRAVTALADCLPGLVHSCAVELGAGTAGSAGVEESLRRALGKEPLPEPPVWAGALHPSRVISATDRDVGSAPTPQDVARGAPGTVLPELGEDEESQELGPMADAFSSPLAGQGPVARLVAKVFGFGRAAGTGPAGAELPMGTARAATRAGARAVLTQVVVPRSEDTDAPQPGVATYPEWDERHARYRPRWCTVLEIEPSAGSHGPVMRHDDQLLRRRLARLGVGLEPTRREPQGLDLDLDAIVEREVDRRVGRGSVPVAVYIDQRRRRRDLSVLVLIDVSGSAGERDAGGATVHAHQRDTAAVLIDTLGALGDRVAAFGFNSRGRGSVHLVRVKTFDDPLDSRVFARLSALEPGGFTRMGAAIRHATHLLTTKAGTPRRLLVVLSDGFAYDHGYEGGYGEADTRRALVEAREHGLGCLCLTIGSGTDREALRRVFGATAYAAAPRFDDLSPLLGLMFRRSIDAAGSHRRRPT